MAEPAKPKSSNLGGYRPGSGRPAELKNRVRLSFYVEKATKERLLRTAETVNTLIEEENADLGEDDRDNLTSASELARFAIREELDILETLGNEDAAKRYRPYLGKPKPTLGGEEDEESPGRVFHERIRFVTYLEDYEKAHLEQEADRINLSIRWANKRVEYKKDHDRTLAWSEIVRLAIDAMFDQYGRRPATLAGALRPYLGQEKP